MAITLPKLERIPFQETASVGRTQLDLPDALPAMQLESKAVIAGVTGVMANEAENDNAIKKIDLEYKKALHGAMDTKTNELVNNFEVETNNLLNGPQGAKYKQGDPVPVFQKLDTDVLFLRQTLIDNHEKLPPEARDMLVKKITASEQKFRMKSDVAYGKQYDDYENKVTDDTVNILKNSLVEDAGIIRPGDPKSFLAFDDTVSKIMSARKTNAMKKGLVGEDGGIHLNTAAVISKDLSDGIYNAIEGLNAKNYPEVAQSVKDKYKDYLDPVNSRKADDSIHKATTEKKAQEAYIRVSGMPEAEAVKELDKLSKQPEIQARATQLVYDQSYREKRMLDMASDNAYSNAFNVVSQKMNSATPYVSVNEMESDPTLRYVMPKISKPEQRKALQSLISRPKESKTDTLVEMFKLNKTGQLKGMTPEEFVKKAKNLNRDDYLRFRNSYDTVNKPPKGDGLSESEERTRVKYMNDKLETSARLYNVIPKSGKPETFSTTEKEHYNKMMQGFMDFYESLPPKMGVAEQDKKVKEYLVQFMQDNPAPKGLWGIFGGRDYLKVPSNVVTPPKKKGAVTEEPAPISGTVPMSTATDLDAMSGPAVKTWMDRYRIENGGQEVPDEETLQKYINSKAGK